MPKHFSIIVLASALWCANAAAAVTQVSALPVEKNPFPTMEMPQQNLVSSNKPVMLTADVIEYYQQEDQVVAKGNVEVVQGETILLCDNLIYDRIHNLVTARGNVSVMEQSGHVMFAQQVELKDDLKTGAIKQFMARLTDDSLFAANSATKVDENVTELEQAVYSPCKLRCGDNGKPQGEPLWQLRADHVRIDEQAQTVTYHDAQMELYGVPVFYTPYMSHATPNADNKSGLMVPEFSRNDNLGNVYKVPFYYAISPDKDAVITPIVTSQEGLVLMGGYRQKFDSGEWSMDGSATNPRERDAAGNPTNGKQFRGHLFSKGQFNVDDNTRWGFDVRRTTDDTYMRRYDIAEDTQLTSKIYTESHDFIGDNDRNFLGVEALAFQGLTAQDDSNRIPLILPLVSFGYESDPGLYDGRFFVDSSALVLTRDIGAETRRLSNTIGWKLPYITEGGQVIEFTSQLRGDIYDVSDVALTNGSTYDGVTGRLIPEASVMWRYPFVSHGQYSSLLVEPIVSLAVSPNGGNPEKIPNEDSQVPEFTDNNLFDTNRFAGYDRVETGTRATYGLRGLVSAQEAHFDWLLGQHYRLKEDQNFPFANDLDSHLSDYIGKLGLQWNKFYTAYRFRVDKETLNARRNEVDLSYAGEVYGINAAYLSLKNDPILASREELVSNATVNVTKNWAFGVGARHDLEIHQMTSMGGQIIFKNECVNVTNMISREFTRDRDVKPNTSFLVRVSLKNLN